ncbi:MAG: (Fe-S)-binding protein [Candidatus Latescibacterota bacterium]|nr:(Fe-S)-binding protein [Candidatus Latescibacterota bacterium]
MNTHKEGYADQTAAASGSPLQGLDYSVVQQCMHCGLCLPTCPTYALTLRERSSPRGRIAMMRAIADGRIETTRQFGEEMYFCLGCLACQTACPAGVDYAMLFESARDEVERSGVLATPLRSWIRRALLNRLFTSRRRLHCLARVLRLYQRTGLQRLVRALGFVRLAPGVLSELEPLTPIISNEFTGEIWERMRSANPRAPKRRVGLIAGCVQDVAFADVNEDTILVLQENGCEVVIPNAQECCGSLHAHNGEVEWARELARRNIDAFTEAGELDAIVINAGGCGSHLRHYDQLLADDERYAKLAIEWSARVKDIHELLVEIGFRTPRSIPGPKRRVAYHDSCHLLHGQGVADAPRQVLARIPNLDVVELVEADWCCGSAGIYNITQPEMSKRLLDRKMGHIEATGAEVVATGNPGCCIQIAHGARRSPSCSVEAVVHPVSLLADAYHREGEMTS